MRPLPSFPVPVPGVYTHYKGRRYEVIGVAQHSETLETLVIYRALYGAGGLWVRPLDNFLTPVAVDGVMQTRFRLVAKGDGER